MHIKSSILAAKIFVPVKHKFTHFLTWTNQLCFEQKTTSKSEHSIQHAMPP